ncbi:protein phosphatase regulator [Ophiocordyceps camponoti-floridani]|uniref:Protein phosphatase regulator n=1 Tax=Ophiocordyceps camponoti-floridani TaxID=2030778 RepID=A0A8H4VAA1_9HYPO|nr:protein phosphatase regulator [Ophiocordyceps camponoti-floridani]
MPYTPPSQLSPASSAPTSPHVSRRSSVQSGSRPALPHSASYLNKHRRTPSITEDAPGRGFETERNTVANSAANSPSPVRPPLASPRPEEHSPSSSTADDDDYQDAASHLDSIRSLRDAVSQISQPRVPSPPLASAHPMAPSEPMRVSLSTTALDSLAAKCSRTSGHVRSATEPGRPALSSADASLTASDDDTDEDLKFKPPMVRKKSGELVRPALRLSHRRPSSVPGTPIFSKAVHFDSHLEHVRHFLQVDRPLAVSAGSSPIDNHESDTEYPFPQVKSGLRSPPYEWELVKTNFPSDHAVRKTLPVRLERVWLSADSKSLLGSVCVANLAFQKHVTCRFTFDYWKTVSEVGADYGHEIGPAVQGSVTHDRFNFSIKLSDVVDLESKTLYFCIRYFVSGQDFWDNNGSTNFQVDFKKKHLPQKGKNGLPGAASRSLNGLPRSNNRRSNTGSSLRPVSMPPSLDAFGHDANGMDFDQPIHEVLGESGPTAGLRLKNKSTTNLASDNIARNLTSPSGVAFSNRYDFGASLSAAMQAAKDSGRDKDTLYMRRNVRGTHLPVDKQESESPLGATGSPSGTQSPNPSLPSASYEELVNKYCFFGSKQSSPMMTDGTLKDGAGCDAGEAQATTPSEKRTAMHHAIHLDGAASYFPPLVTVRSTAARPFAAGSGTPSSELSYRGQQQTMSDRYPWTTETQTATAILG